MAELSFHVKGADFSVVCDQHWLHWVAHCLTLLQYQQLTPSPPYYLPVLLKNLTVSIIGRSPGQPSAPEPGLLGVAGGGHSLFCVQRRTGQRGSAMKERGSPSRMSADNAEASGNCSKFKEWEEKCRLQQRKHSNTANYSGHFRGCLSLFCPLLSLHVRR